MQNKRINIILSLSAILLLGSCATRKTFSTNYYYENEKTLTVIEQSYKEIYKQKHFSLEFTDRTFNYISLEIMTDSIKYIYEFGILEPRLSDTLTKYGLPVIGVSDLISRMRSIRCIWINNLDYYTGNQKNSLVFMSIRNVAIHLPFTYEKYYTLTFYPQPQYFDSEGRLLAGRHMRKLRKINDETFRRINAKVAYTIAGRFR